MIGEKFAPERGGLVSVTRATNEADSMPPPIQVIMDDDFELGSNNALKGSSGATLLLSRSLYETARHLMKGQVAESALIRRLQPIVFPFYS